MTGRRWIGGRASAARDPEARSSRNGTYHSVSEAGELGESSAQDHLLSVSSNPTMMPCPEAAFEAVGVGGEVEDATVFADHEVAAAGPDHASDGLVEVSGAHRGRGATVGPSVEDAGAGQRAVEARPALGQDVSEAPLPQHLHRPDQVDL